MSRNIIFVRIDNMEGFLSLCYLTRLSFNVTAINELYRVWKEAVLAH
jgi:hypothetical protein